MPAFQYPFAFEIRKELLFGNFLDHGANAAALHFLRHFAEGPERLCYLSGRSGSGKTHLLQALCQQADNALYLPLQQLLAHGPGLLDGLESVDLLLLDDLQVLAGKAEWEQALFRLFNALHAGSGKLCIAAAAGPLQLPLLLPDLRSRLQLCIRFELQEPDDAGKLEVLCQQAAQRGMELKEEVAQFILLRSGRNLHELGAVLERLDTLSLSEQRRLTIPFVKAALHW
jgi:DnaA family protein